MELIDKQKLQEAIDEEIYVYSDPENEFQRGYLRAMEKYKAVIALHTFDGHSTQEEIERLKAGMKRISECGSTGEDAREMRWIAQEFI